MPLSLIAYCLLVAVLLVVALGACVTGVVLVREAPHSANVAAIERTGHLAFLFGLLVLALAIAALMLGEPHLAVR